jgi:uncharacterized membrane protein
MEKRKSMIWILFAIGAGLSWGLYGVASHTGQVKLGGPTAAMKALLCVGMAYFVIAVVTPLIVLGSKGQLNNFNQSGLTWSTLCGALGAVGAICIIYAFKNGGSPAYVMPVVFGGAPLVNVLVAMLMHPPKNTPNPLLWVGYVMASAGVGLVLYFKPA